MMKHIRGTRAGLRLAGVGMLLCAFALAGTQTAFAGVRGDNNKGDVWVDNVGQPAGPGHEMDPHLACVDINLWGDALADGSGTYTVDGWSPSGSKEQDYPRSGAGHWTYDGRSAGDQVTDVINVHLLIADAIAHGDAPINSQGFHFKLQFSQDPHKHKTFWVDCPAPASHKPRPTPTPHTAPPPPTPSPTPAPGHGNGGNDACGSSGSPSCPGSDGVNSGSNAGGPGAAAYSGVDAASSPGVAPQSGVLGLSISLPGTGALSGNGQAIALLLALAGPAMVSLAFTVKRRSARLSS